MRGRELRDQFAELFAEDEVRFDLFVGLGVEIREVDGVADFASEQIARDDFGDFNAAFLLRFRGARAEMRRERDAGVLAERMICREWFLQ